MAEEANRVNVESGRGSACAACGVTGARGKPPARAVVPRLGVRAFALCALALLAFGCGDDGDAETYSPVAPGRGDGGARDAAPAGAVDAGGHDNEIFNGDVYLCGYDEDDALVLEANAERAELALAAGEQGFALVHHDAQGGLVIEAVPVAEPPRAPVRILDASEAVQSAALAASGDGFLLAWRSGGAQSGRLRARELSTVEHPVVELSAALTAGPAGGEPFALLGDDDGYLAAFQEDDAGARVLRGLAIGQDGAPRGAAHALGAEDSAGEAEHVELARLDDGRTLLAWLAHNADGEAHVFGQVLASDLSAAGEPVQLSRHPVEGARFDLVGRGPSAGLIYAALDGGVREAIKYRRIAGDGSATEAVLNVVPAPGRAVAGAIAAFGQGYAVAYRALPSLGAPLPVIRVAFINQFGAIVYEAELAETTESAGATALAATADGHLLVSWTSDWPSGRATHALALDCPGALVLCGGPLR